MVCKMTYQIEIANRIERGRCVGNDYVVTQRPIGQTAILARFPEREDAEKWIAQRRIRNVVAEVRTQLGPSVLRPDWRKRRPADAVASWGCCYVAAEAVYHALGGPASGLRPTFVRVGETPHWYLTADDGSVIDPTADQFASPPDYSAGVGKGFLTREPSARARLVLQKAGLA